MAEVSTEVINKDYKDKIQTITDFRNSHGKGVTSQAVNYAIENGLVDYVQLGPRVRVIILTEKTLAYKPNPSPKRNFKSTIRA